MEYRQIKYGDLWVKVNEKGNICGVKKTKYKDIPLTDFQK